VAQSVSPALFDQFARGWRGYVLIGLIALLGSLFGAARIPVTDLDAEARFAQATRQMVESGDYVHIRLQDAARNKKPAGIHWLQAASVNTFLPVTKRTNVIWPYRLPSALGVVLAALATLWAGGILVGQRQAIYGAGLFAAGMLVGFEGMLARADAALLGFTTLALAALAHLRLAPKRQRVLGLVFWGALACGVMIKGPVTPLVAALTLTALFAWEQRAAWMKPLLWWGGPLFAAAIIAPWSFTIASETHGAFFSDMIFGDILPKLFSGHEGQFALPGFHTLLLPLLAFPAAYAMPAAARIFTDAIRAPRNDEAHTGLRFLSAWAVPTLIFFELAPTKLIHYAMPAYPAIALLCGAGLQAMRGRSWRTAHPAGLVMFAVAGAVIVSATALAATLMPGDFAADIRRAVSAGVIGISVVAFGLVGLVMLRRPAARAAVLIACALILSFSLRERLLPEARTFNVSSEVVAALTRARLMPRDDRPLWVAGYDAASLIFLTRTSIRMTPPELAAAQADVGDALVVEGRALQTVAAGLSTRGLAFTQVEQPVRGYDLESGNRVALFIGQVDTALSAPPADGQSQSP